MLIWPSRGTGNVTFVRVSTGQPIELYTRNYNQPGPAGPFLWHLQGFLYKIGFESAAEHLVKRGTLFDGHNDEVCAVIGMNGVLPDFKEFGAAVIAGNEVIPLRFEGSSVVDGTERHRVWFKSAPRNYVPTAGVLLVTNLTSGKTLINYKY